MASSTITRPPVDQAISGARAEDILRTASDLRTQLVLHDESGTTVRATVYSIGDGTIRVRVGGLDASALSGATGSLEADFSIDGRPYSFTTDVLERSDDGDLIGLASPDEITLRQRRRSRRYRLARARVVEIRDDAGGDLLGTGTLLNLSPDGIAAKAADTTTDRCRSGQACQVRFRLDDDTTEFEVSARITNVTPAGDPGRVVLGMEFLHNGSNDAVRADISRALSGLARIRAEGSA